MSMNCVLPNLYLGGILSLNAAKLKDHGITHILSLFSDEVKEWEDSSFQRLHIQADDDEDQDLLQHFPKAISFIHEARKSGGKCLVHCIAGISRSSTMVIAYVMALTGCRWREALASIKGYHKRAFPNMNFQKQLLVYEKKDSKEEGSRDHYKAILLNGDSPTQEENNYLEAGRQKFEAFVHSG